MDTCMICNDAADVHDDVPRDHPLVSTKDVEAALDALRDRCELVAEAAMVSAATAFVLHEHTDQDMFVIPSGHATSSAVITACMKLLVAISEGAEEIEEWLDEYHPDGPTHRRNRELHAMRILDPEKWAGRVVSAIGACNGNKEQAAHVLKIARRTLFRWLKDPAVVERMKS